MDKLTDAHIFLFYQHGSWVALAQNDFAAQGATPQEAIDSLERLILGQAHLDKQLEGSADAPETP